MLRRIVQLSFNRIVGQSLTIILGCALLLLMPAIAFADEPPKNVLLFYSDEISRPGNVLVTQAIRSTLTEQWKSTIQIYDEGQDSFRIPNEKYEAELVALLQRKYEGVHFDLIFAFAPPGLRFLSKHKASLFPDAPIVFIVNEQKRIADLKLENTTGVSGKVEVTPTLELALALHPQTQRIVVAGGTALLDRDLLALAQKEFKPYEGKASFTYLTDMTLEELRQRLAVLPEQTVVIFLSFNSDSSGKAYASHEVVSRLAESSSAPIYSLNQVYFGTGIVGGRLLSYEAVGRRAAEIGVRILGGERAQNISPQVLPSVTMVDWRQLRRWGIDENQIPPGSIVRYKEFSVWELYKWRIAGVISLCILEALLIAWLLFTRAERRKAVKESERNEHALQQLSGRLLLLQDEEQRRVAGELHDGLGQNLAIIKNRALIGLRDRTDQDRVTEQLEEIVATATSSIGEVREIARNWKHAIIRGRILMKTSHSVSRLACPFSAQRRGTRKLRGPCEK